MRTASLVLLLITLIGVSCDRPAGDASGVRPRNTSDTLQTQQLQKTPKEPVLAEIADEDLVQTIVDHVCQRIAAGSNREDQVVAGLQEGVRAIYTTWVVEAEVNNGGFHQFFWNRSEQFAREALKGFEAIGAPKTAKLMQEAMDMASRESEKMKPLKAEGTLKAFSASYKLTQLDELDGRFYKYEEDLSALRVKYISEHKDLCIGR